ncbi:sorting nexin-14-like [Bacillus rossius redtenbacheri]|uniref:sorting nexin-14-like n=1 Tax=Bacillus rossius redtenbacheri TaxID=93214 RepID=UPI002FDE5802
MDENEAKNYVFIVWNDKLIRTTIFLVLFLSFFVFFSFSVLSGALVLSSYAAGFVVFDALFRHRAEAPNLLAVVTQRQRAAPLAARPRTCGVCGDGRCDRHRPAAHARAPWAGLAVPVEVDEAIEDFLNKVLSEFVYFWYRNLSADEDFVQELRQGLRHAASVLLHRGLQVDLARLITGRLVPAGLGHLDDYLGALRLAARHGAPLEEAAARQLGARLHPAARSREAELAYLRHLVSLLLPRLLPPGQLACGNVRTLVRELLAGWVLLPLADVLADPSVVNSLLLLLLGPHQLTQHPDKPPATVEFLARFASSAPAARVSALRLDLSSILKNQQLLYPFMQFLKAEGCVNVLQFCLDVEEFNRKMLTPELGPRELETLYQEAWDLFSVYFSPESPDRIAFPPGVVEGLRAVLRQPPEAVAQLRTTPPLFQAYEHAYGLLENVLCPLFHQSDDYYVLLCGQRLPNGFSKSGSRGNKKWSDSGAVARISSRLNKIKGALRSQPVEGHTFETDSTLDLGESEFAEDLRLAGAASGRDLNAWRVSIPSVQTRPDPSHKSHPVFSIHVQRIDVSSQESPEACHWTVDRRYNDFYALESKLTEFHGDFADTHLPPKRLLFEPRGPDYLERKRQDFEHFLQSLLQKPNLRGSDLLHAFLRSSGEFVPAPSGLAGAVPEGLGRMIRRSVPIRLRKERGQHLDSFLAAFLQSVEAGRARPSKYEWKDVNLAQRRQVRCLTRSVFGDNFGVAPGRTPLGPAGDRGAPVQGTFDCVLYLAVRVFAAPQPAVRLALAVRALLRSTVDAVADLCLDRKLRRLLAAPRLARLVHLLRGAVFQARGAPPSPADLEARAGRALEQLEALLPAWLARWAGPGYRAGLLTLFAAVQSPQLNKQLVHSLLDLVVEELYPDLAAGEISPQPGGK